MSRQLLFLLATVAVMVYFSIILFMLVPLHTAGPGEARALYSRVGCKKLRYRDPPARDAVALASFPGSGNTWLRYLLQEATGIPTGSIYMDYGLYTHGFPAENVTDGSVLVVKTHKYDPEAYRFSSVVLLIRNPRDAILADFHRIHRGHLGSAPRSAFRLTAKHSRNTDWRNFVSTRTAMYEDLYTSYLQKFSGRLLLVMYEDLVQDTEATLRRVLDFLNVTVTQEDMNCAMAYKEGIYRRRKKSSFDPFTPDMYRELERANNRVHSAIVAYLAANNHTTVVH